MGGECEILVTNNRVRVDILKFSSPTKNISFFLSFAAAFFKKKKKTISYRYPQFN